MDKETVRTEPLSEHRAMASLGVAFETQQETPRTSKATSQVRQRISTFRHLAPISIEEIRCRSTPPERMSRLAVAAEFGEMDVRYPHPRERFRKVR